MCHTGSQGGYGTCIQSLILSHQPVATFVRAVDACYILYVHEHAPTRARCVRSRTRAPPPRARPASRRVNHILHEKGAGAVLGNNARLHSTVRDVQDQTYVILRYVRQTRNKHMLAITCLHYIYTNEYTKGGWLPSRQPYSGDRIYYIPYICQYFK
jgi:hypothetical protein